MTALLPFQRRVVDALLDEDALCIVARGLGLRRVVAEFCRICATPQALVFLLNASDTEEQALQQQLMALRSGHADACTLRVIKNETNPAARAQLYRQGGLISVTSRILVVDLLNDIVPIELVTGLIVLDANRVTAESTEAFILRMMRSRNPQAFVKAVSESPESFTLGFAPLEKTLKALGLRHVQLWPRFHVLVQEDLACAKAPVAELRLPPTRAMIELQQAALDCVSATISELSSATKLLDPDAINVESSLFRYFDALVKRMLAPHWHRLNARVRGMVTDLAALRRVAELITAYDCVSLLKYLDTLLLATKSPTQAPPLWLASDSANILYSVARSRVFSRRTAAEASGDEANADQMRLLGLPGSIVPALEVPPKLLLLAKLLEEVGVANRTAIRQGRSSTSGPVLVMTGSARECQMIRTFLATAHETVDLGPGGKHPKMMADLLRGFFRWKAHMNSGSGGTAGRGRSNNNGTNSGATSSPSVAAPPQPQSQAACRGAPAAKRRRVRGASAAGAKLPRAPADALEQETATLAAHIEIHADGSQPLSHTGLDDPHGLEGINPDDIDDGWLDAADEMPEFDEFYGILPASETVLVRPYSTSGDSDFLSLLQPTHIILYDPDPAFIRQVEMYQAQGHVLSQVYFMVYDNSIEEQRYLSAIRRERESFETLIRQNASLVIPISTASPVNALLLARRSQRTAVHIPMGTPTIVVDVREFYSPLPSLLHAAGFNVVPRTIAVGDYILHDHLCVERKSLPDLIQSLRSGRLFNQAESMIAHYSYAVLLIEFEMNTSFSLQAIGSLNPDIAVNSINSQLTMLVLTFPRLRIVWSSSPYETASIFTELKRDAAEPDIDRAVAMGQDDSSVEKESIYASHPISLLQSLPGVTLRNYQALANRFKSISDICAASKDDLVSVLGMEAAIKLYEFIRNSSAN
ncbi:DNA repair protein RAD16 [Coemansia sp. IMI 209128]|nr:DNA repair protein RAD16 [Coemansia sp. IMI 209128]